MGKGKRVSIQRRRDSTNKNTKHSTNISTPECSRMLESESLSGKMVRSKYTLHGLVMSRRIMGPQNTGIGTGTVTASSNSIIYCL
jgi:hypothetical protein